MVKSFIYTNVQEQHNLNSSNEDKLFEKEQIEGSPFWAIGNKQTGYYLTVRNIRLSQKQNSIKEVKEFLKNNSYNCIISAILCIIDIKAAEENKSNNKLKTKT